MGFVVELLRQAKAHAAHPAAMAALFFALRAVACNDDAVQQICAGGGLATAERHLETHAADASVCRQVSAACAIPLRPYAHA